MSEKPEALRLADECEEGAPLEEDAKAAAAELRRLHAEVEALRADALRYRWIRDQGHKGGGDFYFRATGQIPRDALDAAIDAAMAKEQTK